MFNTSHIPQYPIPAPLNFTIYPSLPSTQHLYKVTFHPTLPSVLPFYSPPLELHPEHKTSHQLSITCSSSSVASDSAHHHRLWSAPLLSLPALCMHSRSALCWLLHLPLPSDPPSPLPPTLPMVWMHLPCLGHRPPWRGPQWECAREACSSTVASEVGLSLIWSKGAVLEAAVVKLRYVVIDVCHSQRDPYVSFGLLPVDVGVHLGGLRAELKPEGRGQRTSIPKELRSKIKVGVQRVGVQREWGQRVGVQRGQWPSLLTVTCTCTSSSSSSSCSLSRGLLTVITPSCLPISNHPGLVESGKRQQEQLLPVALTEPPPSPAQRLSLGTPRSHWRCCRSQGSLMPLSPSMASTFSTEVPCREAQSKARPCPYLPSSPRPSPRCPAYLGCILSYRS